MAKTNAIIIDRFGDPNVMHWQKFQMPVLQNDSVLIKSVAIAVNPIDLGTRAGRVIPANKATFPMVLGWGLAGTVMAVGAQVTQWKSGDSIIGYIPQPRAIMGAYAEDVIMSALGIARHPKGIASEVAALLPLAGLTAYSAVKALALQPGETLLINGVLGSVGSIAAQLAILQGAQVFGMVMPQDASTAQGLGIIGLDRTQDISLQLPAPVDASLDVVGGASAQAIFEATKSGGRYATTVPEWWVPGGPFAPRRGISPAVIEQKDPANLPYLASLLEQGNITLANPTTMPLREASKAHALLGEGKIKGKVVLLPDS